MRRRRLPAALPALFAAIALVLPARADEASKARAQARFEAAEQAAAELRFADALAGYRAAAAEDPSASFARLARARAEDLETHAEGGFVPLARLEAVRRDPRKSGDRAVIEALERDLAGFPDGRVRAEARLVVAEAWWHRLGDPRRAIAPLEAVAGDASADRLTRGLGLTELTAVERDLGDLDAARAAVDRYPDLAPGVRTEVIRLHRRARARVAAVGLLAALAIVGAASFVRAARKLGGVGEVQRAVVRPLAVAFSLYLGGAAAVLVRLRGDGDPRPFVWLGLGVLAMDVVARTWRLGSGAGRAPARAGRAILCAAGVLAAAFLAVERVDPSYLEGLGL
jgi:tetratricopeptide (TPR) repeat protein